MPSNSIPWTELSYTGHKVQTMVGLPFRAAVLYVLLFVASFWFYSLLWAKAPVLVSDSGSYLRAAQDLSDFRIEQLHERAPGYPLFLVLTASSNSPNRTLFFASLLLHSASIWLLGAVLHRAGLTDRMLFLFGFILLLPPYVEPAAYVLTENLTEAMLVVGFGSFGFWALSGRTVWLIVSAVAIASAALTRPTYQLLAIAVAGYVLVASSLIHSTLVKWKDLITAGAIVVCVSMLMMGGFAFINYRTVGHFGVSPVLGFALTQKTGRVLERLPDEHAAVRETLIRARNAALTTEPGHTGSAYVDDAIPELMKVTGLGKAQLSNHLLRLNLVLIQTAPAEYLHEVVWAFGSYWFPASGEFANLNSRPVQLLWAVIHFCLIGGFAVNVVLLVGAVAYITMSSRLLHRGVLVSETIHFQCLMYGLAGMIVFYTAAVSCLIQDGMPRYRVPTDGLIIFMLFLGLHLWRRIVDLSGTLFLAKHAKCL